MSLVRLCRERHVMDHERGRRVGERQLALSAWSAPSSKAVTHANRTSPVRHHVCRVTSTAIAPGIGATVTFKRGGSVLGVAR